MNDFKYESQLNGTRDFVRGERFIFKTPACKCEVMQVPQGDEQKKEYFDLLVITEDTDSRKEHVYVYAPQSGGMVGYDVERDELKLDITPLDELLGLQHKNEKWSQKMAKYIEKYGFFWPVNWFSRTENKMLAIKSDVLFRYIKPLCKLHELLENLAIADTSARHLIDYDRIFELTLFYIFYCRVPRYAEEEGPLIEEPGDRFSFAALWWNGLSDYKLYKELDDENFEEEIKSTNSPPKPNTNCEITIHSTADTTKISQIIKKLSQSEREDSESKIQNNDKKDYSYDISYVIWYSYKHIPLGYEEAREIVDFLFRFIREVGEIKYLDRKGNVELKVKGGLEYNVAFDTSMKKELLKIAKKVCKTELDWGMKNIHPIYDIEEKRPDWKIPDLYSALYFAHFYCDSQYSIRRKCQSPSCDKYFLVRRTNAKKKYCDTCKGNVQKINKRQEKLRRE